MVQANSPGHDKDESVLASQRQTPKMDERDGDVGGASVSGNVLSDSELEQYRKALLTLRDRLTGQVTQLRNESLTRDDEVNPEEDGTDAFERLFSLERASGDQEIIFNIDEALRSLDAGTYGMCEMCECSIEKPRLQALPFAKHCVKCQSEFERTQGGYARPRRVAMG